MIGEIAPRRTAWHEAGHAVVAWQQGFTPVHVSIRREGDSFGRSTHTPAGDWTIPQERQRECIVAMAGWAAELQSGEAHDGDTYDSADLSIVMSGLDRYAAKAMNAEFGWAESEAQRIVLENLDRIKRLANELLQQTGIDGADKILDIIQGTT